MKKLKDCFTLFLLFFKIGLFTFGGGYAMISVISHEVVEKKKYIDANEFSDLVAIAESTPGPIAINSATYIGYRKAGVLGSIFASVGVGLPSLIIIYLISLFFQRILEYDLVQKAFAGIQCGVSVLIISAAFKLMKSVKKNAWSYVLAGLSFALLLLVNLIDIDISTIYFVLAGAIAGILIYYRPKKKSDNGLIAQDLPPKGDNSQVLASEKLSDTVKNDDTVCGEVETAQTAQTAETIETAQTEQTAETIKTAQTIEAESPQKVEKRPKMKAGSIVAIAITAFVILTLFFFGGLFEVLFKDKAESLADNGAFTYFLTVCELFSTFFKIGLFSFGGGYGMLPLMLEETVGRGWITEAEFTNFIAVAESTPGPIAINMATYLGSTQAGLLGSILSTIGVMAPSVIVILTIVALLKNFLSYSGVRAALNGMKPVICGMIFETGLLLCMQNFLPDIKDLSFKVFIWQALLITFIAGGLTLLFKFVIKKNLSPILLIVISAVLGMLLM